MCKDKEILNDLSEGFDIIGKTDTVTTCDLCGKTNLKVVYMVRSLNGNDYAFGSTCGGTLIARSYIKKKYPNIDKVTLESTYGTNLKGYSINILEQGIKDYNTNQIAKAHLEAFPDRTQNTISFKPISIYHNWVYDEHHIKRQSSEPDVWKNVINRANNKRIELSEKYNITPDDVIQIPKEHLRLI